MQESELVLITGAARGIGKNIARKFANNGCLVVIADCQVDTGRETVSEIIEQGGRADFCELDLLKPKEFDDVIQELFSKYGRIDALINNARAGSRMNLEEETDENWQLALDVSLKAPFFLSQAFIKQSPEQSNSCIVNISSVAARSICAESASYHVSKAGLENLTRYLAIHAGHKGIRCNAIRPGFIVQDEHLERYWSEGNTQYRKTAESCHPLGKIGSSDDVANCAIFLSSQNAAFINGQTITVDGGLLIQDPSALVYKLQ